MMRSLFSGVSGLRNHQTKMDVIGNNIANINTVGFKRGRVNFQEMLVQTIRGASAPQGGRGGVNAQQVGLGVQVASIDYVQTQGNLQSTGKTTDLALQGDGFFILSDGADQLYTRTGIFDLDQDGNLIFASNGMKVMGWTTVDAYGKIVTNTSLTNITIPIGQSMKPQATEAVTYANNLDASAKLGTVHQTQVEVYDSVGNAHTIVTNFEKLSVDADGNTTWGYTVSLGNNDAIIQTFIGQFDTYDSLLPGGPGDPIPTPTTKLETQYQVLNLAQRAAFLANPNVTIDGKPITKDLKFSDLVQDTGNPAFSIRDQVSYLTGGAANFDSLDVAQKLFILEAAYAAVEANKQVAAGNPKFSGDYSLNVTAPYTGAGTVFGNNYYIDNLGVPYPLTVTDPAANTDPSVAETITIKIYSDSDPTGFTITLTETGPNTGIFQSDFNFTNGASNAATRSIKVKDGDTITIEYGGSTVDTARWYTTTYSPEYVDDLLKVQTSLGIDKLNPRYGYIIFDQSGQLKADETRLANLIIDPKNINLTRAYSFSPSGAKTVNIIPDFKSLTQYTSPFTASAVNQNGNPAGTLQSFTIDKNGTVTGIFSNGFTKDLAVIAIANFNNPGGLMKMGENLFKRSNNSGLAQIGPAGTGGRGSITPGALEMSNVDLSQEFTDMIVTQRGFQANSRIITTSDEMLQELVNLKR